jgi:predicted nucleotidyltransferase
MQAFPCGTVTLYNKRQHMKPKTEFTELEELLKGYMTELMTLIHTHLPDATIYLFGSRARKDYKEGADIDIAIKASEPIPLDTLLKLYLGLEDTRIPVSVDFVDFNRTSPALIEIIKKEGILWNKQL